MDNSKKPNYEIRHLTTDDLEMYNALLRYAFQVTEQELTETGWRDDEIKQSKFPVLERADVLGCFDGETLSLADRGLSAGYEHLWHNPLHWLCYQRLHIPGIHGARHHEAADAAAASTDMRERKQSFAMLFPYSIPLYRRFGYEIISNKISYTVKDRQIPAEGKSARLRPPRRLGERATLWICTQSLRRSTHGCLYRNALAWEEYWRWDEDDTVVAVYYDP